MVMAQSKYSYFMVMGSASRFDAGKCIFYNLYLTENFLQVLEKCMHNAQSYIFVCEKVQNKKYKLFSMFIN